MSAFQVKSGESGQHGENGGGTGRNRHFRVKLDSQLQPIDNEIVALGQDWSVLSQ